MNEIPIWEGFLTPVLEVLSDGKPRNRRELGSDLLRALDLPPDQVQLSTASGQPIYMNRMGWALSFLTNVGALQRPSRGIYTITAPGRDLLTGYPQGLTEKLVLSLGEDASSAIRPYVATSKHGISSAPANAADATMTPTEQVQSGISRIQGEIGAELIARLQDREPAFFETAVVDLLLAMGYGGVGGSGAVTQLTNDGGIDGVIDQDVLGLSKVYVQAKRYGDGNTVGRPDVQAFVGALAGKADSGVFITTSRFAPGAYDYANTVPTRIILIDGVKLAELMIRFEVGVQVAETYKVVEIDEDFFS